MLAIHSECEVLSVLGVQRPNYTHLVVVRGKSQFDCHVTYLVSFNYFFDINIRAHQAGGYLNWCYSPMMT